MASVNKLDVQKVPVSGSPRIPSPHINSTTSREESISRCLLRILDSNALICALFITFEVGVLRVPVQNLSPARSRIILYFSSAAIISHTLCVLVAVEATYVVASIQSKFLDDEIRCKELRVFRTIGVGRNVIRMSGYSFIAGIPCVFIALGAILWDIHEYPHNDIVGLGLAGGVTLLSYFFFTRFQSYLRDRCFVLKKKKESLKRGITRENQKQIPDPHPVTISDSVLDGQHDSRDAE